MQRLPRIAMSASLLVLLTQAGCLFDTRDPVPGGGEACFEPNNRATFGEVFENLDESLQCLDATVYLDGFADDFEYVPASGGVVQPWGKDEEERFINELVASGATIVADSRSGDVNPPSGTTVVLVEASYSFLVNGIEYTGEAFYTLEAFAGSFQITRWEEKASANPLAVLRGDLVQ